MSTQLVTVVEVAAALGGPGEMAVQLIDRAGGKVVEDWKGDPAVSADTAAEVVRSYRTSYAEHTAKQAQYDRYLEDRERDRRAAGEEARAEVRKRRGSLDPMTEAMALEAAREAIAVFDKKHPAVPFTKFTGSA